MGTVSNRQGIGARVEAFATIGGTPVHQMRERGSQSGYNSAADPRLHFGLGDATVVDSLVIAWPSGLVETRRSVSADQVLPLVEGATLTGAPVSAASVGPLTLAPNPTRGSTVLRWSADRRGPATVRVFDLRGRLLRALTADAGAREAIWDGRDQDGQTVSAGVYFVAVAFEGRTEVARVTLLR